MSAERKAPARVQNPTSRSGGASQLRVGWRDHLDAARRHHRISARDALRRLLATPLTSLLTVLVLAVALSLPTLLYVVLDNLRDMTSQVEGQAQISLFLKLDVSDDAQRALAERIGKRDDVAQVKIITRTQALAEFRAQSGYAEALDMLENNPLPGVILVQPRSVNSADGVRAALATDPAVDSAQLDSAWLQKLQALLDIGGRLAQALAAAFVLAVLLVVVNTIRLAVENRRAEILVSRLVGATDAYVRRPFLYTGLWTGLAGGLGAVLMVASLVAWLSGPVTRLAGLYGSSWALHGLDGLGALVLVATGAVLGVVGAWLAVRRHLRGEESL